MKEKKRKLFYPECIFSLDQISSSTFLYFPDNLGTTMHPTLSIYNTGCDPYKFVKLIQEGNYKFGAKFYPIFKMFETSSKMIHNTFDILKPMYDKKYLSSIWLAYPRNKYALDKSEEIIKKSGLSINELYKHIDKTMACQEFISHILFEMFLEFYHNQTVSIDKNKNASYEETRAKSIDYKLLLDYCEDLFLKFSVEELLVKTYLFRLQQLDYFNDILISNNGLIPLLNSFKPEQPIKEPSYYDNLDVISWEIFRQLTDKYLSQKSHQERISKIIDLRDVSQEEIQALKNKCKKLGEQFKGEKNTETLEENIAEHVKIYTSKEIQDLLKLDNRIFENLIDSIFSDYKSWLGVSSFLTSIIVGNTLFTAGAGLAALASIGSKTYKEVANSEKIINDSEYALIYRLHN